MIIPPLPPHYDWRELRRWKIDEQLLPKGSTVLFRSPTNWQKHRGWIIGAASVMVVQTMLIAALIRNLLRRRLAERSLGESEDRALLAAEAAHLGVWELNSVTGEMWVSKKARELFDLEADNAVTLAVISNRVHPADRSARAAAIEAAIQGRGHYELEYRIVRLDDTVRWISGRGRYMNDAQGNPTRLVGVSMDVTERKEDISARQKAEEEARRQREQLELLGRVSLLGEMTASIAHELNQPLAAIVANSSAGVRFIDAGEIERRTLREIFADIGAAGRRASSIILTVRNAIKKGEPVRGHVSLNSVVTSVTHVVRADAAANSCDMKTLLAEDLPVIEADPVQIQQVLMNLVTNAFHAMSETPPPQREIEITTPVQRQRHGVFDRARSWDGHLTGGARLPVRSFLHHTKDGLGMGLAIVRSIVEAHGGSVKADNAANGGACFEIQLPTVRNQ